MAHDSTLWGIGTSRTMRAHWMLLELGLEYFSIRFVPGPVKRSLTNSYG